MSTGGAQEPNAESRIGAANLWQTFLALTAEGFSETQALNIIGQLLIASALGNRE